MNTVDALVQLSFHTQRLLTTLGTRHDMSLIQIRMLGILRGRTPGMLELGAYLGLDKSSMSGLVTRAEKRGLVERTPSPHDGRAVLVSLTPAGEHLTDECTAEITRQVAAWTAHLTPEEQATLTHLAQTLIQNAPA